MANYNDSNDSEQMAQKAAGAMASVGKAAGRGAKKAIRNGGKNIKKAAKAIKKAVQAMIKVIKIIIKFLASLGWVGLVIAILFAVIFAWAVLFRGVSGSMTLESEYANPTYVNEDGIYQSSALTEQNAYIDAYYKYLSIMSHRKFYNGVEYQFGERDDNGVTLTEEQLADFAGLEDYYQREEYFYLSSYFIKLADEYLHNDQFYYPEQIIKPVLYEINDGVIEAVVPLEDDKCTAMSYPYEEDGLTLSTTQTTGVWDYGFGSVLQYTTGNVDEWIDCTYTTVEVHRHLYYWVRHWEPPVYDTETGDLISEGYYYYTLENKCVETPFVVNIEGCTTVAEIENAIDEQANDEPTPEGGASYYQVETMPNSQVLQTLVSENNSHVALQIMEADEYYATRKFSDVNLQTAFGNDKAKPENLGTSFSNMKDVNLGNYTYPIKVPLIEHAALMSGNISYSYTDKISKYEIPEETVYAESDLGTTVVYDLGSSCGGELKVTRKGNYYIQSPQATETDDPWGFDYISVYGDNYSNYIPETVSSEYDFTDRIGASELELMSTLGLLDEAVVGPLDEVVSVADIDQDLIQGLAHYLDSYDSCKLFTRKMIAAAAVNQYKAGTKSFSGTSTSETNILIAEEALSGTFAIPKNVYMYSYLPADNEGYMIIYDGGYTLYFTAYDKVSALDWAGRSAKDAEEIENLDNAAYEEFEYAQYNGKLYKDEVFNVKEALTLIQECEKDKGFLGTVLETVTEPITSSLSYLFQKIGAAFPVNDYENVKKVYWDNPYKSNELRMAVYQAISFSNKVDVETIRCSIEDAEDLTFLFVGKEGFAGVGTYAFARTWIPGTATTIDGFYSPTASYFSALEEFSGTNPYVVVSAINQSIQSVYSGTVTSVNTSSTGHGKSVTVQYEKDGVIYCLTYGNLNSINVSQGQSVEAKQLIGTSGTEGLYLYLTVDGEVTDPLSIFYQSVLSAGIPFEDLLDENGNVSSEKAEAFLAKLTLNYSYNGNIQDPYYLPTINNFSIGQCTWWAYGRMLSYLDSIGASTVGVTPKGDAQSWYAGYAGVFKTGNTPKANALVVWSGGGSAHITKYGHECGHVGYVEAVDADGTVWVSEGGIGYGHATLRSYSAACSYGTAYKLLGFVYLDEPL